MNGRYGLHGPYNSVKSTEYLQLLLKQKNERWFRDVMRRGKSILILDQLDGSLMHSQGQPRTFQALVTILGANPLNSDLPNPLFTRKDRGLPPTSLPIQLANFLLSTSGSTHITAARETAASEGSSYNFLNRIWALPIRDRRRLIDSVIDSIG